jgi:cysteinyl-tRNA synthetase
MQVMIELRNQFRQNKDFKGSDMIRDRLGDIGISLKDSKEGTQWE